jgi:hypothetical protein
VAEFKPKDQIIYIPYHADGDETHRDCEYGFVTSIKEAADSMIIFCRFWYKVVPGQEPYMRTKSCSESVVDSRLILKDSVDPEIVEKAWRMYVEPTMIQKESDGE